MGVAHARAETFDAAKNLFRITLTGGGTVVGFEFENSDRAKAILWNGFTFTRQAE